MSKNTVIEPGYSFWEDINWTEYWKNLLVAISDTRKRKPGIIFKPKDKSKIYRIDFYHPINKDSDGKWFIQMYKREGGSLIFDTPIKEDGVLFSHNKEKKFACLANDEICLNLSTIKSISLINKDGIKDKDRKSEDLQVGYLEKYHWTDNRK